MAHTPLSCGRFIQCQHGGIMIAWAILLPVIAGMMGLGVETGTWYLKKRDLQAVADVAAIAGAFEITPTSRDTSARNSVINNGFSSATRVTVSVNNPPASGSLVGDNNAVEVILSQPQSLLFSSLFLSAQPIINVRAVALKNTTPANNGGCVLALNPTGNPAINTSGTTNISMPNCTIVANSNDPRAIQLRGGAVIDVNALYTRGNYDVSNNATLNMSSTAITNAANPVSDPYQNLAVPSNASCNYNNTPGGSSLSPGVYCGGLNIGSHANVTLRPGVYVVKGGDFRVNSGAVLNGTDVTIILTGSNGTYSTASINGGSTVNLSAPTSGNYAGIAFYQDRNANAGTSSTFNGGSGMNITGAIYMPQGSVSFNGGNSTASPSCTQLVSWNVIFTGNSNVTNNCPSSGMQPISTAGNTSGVTLEE